MLPIFSLSIKHYEFFLSNRNRNLAYRSFLMLWRWIVFRASLEKKIKHSPAHNRNPAPNDNWENSRFGTRDIKSWSRGPALWDIELCLCGPKPFVLIRRDSKKQIHRTDKKVDTFLACHGGGSFSPIYVRKTVPAFISMTGGKSLHSVVSMTIAAPYRQLCKINFYSVLK